MFCFTNVLREKKTRWLDNWSRWCFGFIVCSILIKNNFFFQKTLGQLNLTTGSTLEVFYFGFIWDVLFFKKKCVSTGDRQCCHAQFFSQSFRQGEEAECRNERNDGRQVATYCKERRRQPRWMKRQRERKKNKKEKKKIFCSYSESFCLADEAVESELKKTKISSD